MEKLNKEKTIILNKNFQSHNQLSIAVEDFDSDVNYNFREDFHFEKLTSAINLKRIGKYEKSKEILLCLYKECGGSGELYIALGKVFACLYDFESAIYLFNLACEISKKEFGKSSYIGGKNLHMLNNRHALEKETFLKYLKNISGNKNHN